MVKEKYKNNFSYFLKTFAKKGAVKQKREEQGLNGDDPHKLNAYSDYLIVAFRSGLKDLEDNFNKEKILKIKTELDYYSNCFKKHFNRDISKFV